MILSVPAIEATPYPSLGWLLVPWMEKNLVFGPGDLRGDKLVLSAERKMLIYRMYEVYPHDHPWAGRRRFRRCAMSVRKGVGKSEFGALIAAAELDESAPVRCIGFDKRGRPLGYGVREAYVPFVAVTAEQSEELAYGALKAILELSPIAKKFDIGMTRIMRKDGSGKAVSLANSPDARDGARTSMMLCDETHRWVRPALKASHKTMLANLPKRKKADPWALEVTTSPCPGENSVAEDTMSYARAVADGRKVDSDLFFFHRQANDRYVFSDANGEHFDLNNEANVREAVIDASGPDAEWSDIDGIAAQFRDPTNDRSYLCRVWLNQLVRASDKAFDVTIWDRRVRDNYEPERGAMICIGFDGAISEDSTALIATELRTGFQWPLGIWEKPYGSKDWRVPEHDVDATVDAAFTQYDVWRFYADPYFWENWVATWIGRYGIESYTNQPRVVAWPTNIRGYKMPGAVRGFMYAMHDEPRTDLGIEHKKAGDNEIVITDQDAEKAKARLLSDVLRISHSGDPRIRRHVANAYRKYLTLRDANNEFLWVIQKDQPNSPNKIDGAMASILSWEARRDAVAAGVVNLDEQDSYAVEWIA